MSCHIVSRITELKCRLFLKGNTGVFFFKLVSTVQVHLSRGGTVTDTGSVFFYFLLLVSEKAIFTPDEKQHPLSEIINHSKRAKSLCLSCFHKRFYCSPITE